MRHSKLWVTAWSALVTGAVMLVGGLLDGSKVGSLVAAYGLLLVLAAGYMCVGLAIRDRVRRARVSRPDHVEVPSILGRRVF
jgi:hypothetical protein